MTEKRLAMFGGKQAVSTKVERYNSIGEEEATAVRDAVRHYPLSGYLGGQPFGGAYVQRLEGLWAEKFGVKHAIAVNSATSGLLAAADACGLFTGTTFIATPFTMSATAAACSFMGAKPVFSDIDYNDFCLDPARAEFLAKHYKAKAIVVTDLFGGTAQLAELREIADRLGIYLIEDAAQSILATENEVYAGTAGDVGVFSLNVHKHIQCGEGGVIVTEHDELAARMRAFINHSELMNGPVGLNLRMPEVCAAIAISQLRKADDLVAGRIEQAERLKKALLPFGIWAGQQPIRQNVKHVYYVVPFMYRKANDKWPDRDTFLKALAAEGVPMVGGYVTPLTKLPGFTEAYDEERQGLSHKMNKEWLFYFSNCEWTLSDHHYDEISSAFQKIWDNIRAGNLGG